MSEWGGLGTCSACGRPAGRGCASLVADSPGWCAHSVPCSCHVTIKCSHCAREKGWRVVDREEDAFQLGISMAFWADREVALVTVLGQAKGQGPAQGPALSQGEPGGLDLACYDGMPFSSPVLVFSFCAACPSPHLEGLVHLGCSNDL